MSTPGKNSLMAVRLNIAYIKRIMVQLKMQHCQVLDEMNLLPLKLQPNINLFLSKLLLKGFLPPLPFTFQDSRLAEDNNSSTLAAF